MGRTSISTKMNRLNQLVGRLKSGDIFTASQLSKDFGVSQRTLMRDIEVLKEQGYPIEAEQGRGGGIRLHARWGIGRLALNYREVIDLLLALAILDRLDSALFLTHLSSVKNKLFASFPDTQRPHIQQLRQRIMVGSTASEQVLESYRNMTHEEVSDSVMEAFVESRCVEISYQREGGALSTRIVEIHYLFLNWPVWYLFCWDHLRQANRTFRIDRLSHARLMDQSFRIKPFAFFDAELQQIAKTL